jgi:hypothetical protein
MEQAERVEVAVDRGGRAYERYGWIILASSTIVGIVSALMTTLPPITWFWDPLFQSGYSIMGAWGVTWVGFDLLALVIALIPYRRHERWAWYTLWALPLFWLSQFVFSPDYLYLLLAVLTTAGLVLPYRRFFPGRDKEPSRVR